MPNPVYFNGKACYFGNPNVTTTASAFGQIADTGIPRQMQFQVKFEF